MKTVAGPAIFLFFMGVGALEAEEKVIIGGSRPWLRR